MTKIGPSRAARAKSVLAALREVVNTLPGQEEKEEMHKALEALIDYLRHLQKELAVVPSRDEFADAMVTVERLEALLMRAEQNPVVARAIGLQRARPRRREASIPQATREQAAEVLRRFESFTVDQVREALRDEGRYSVSELRSMAAALGIRVQARASRESLATQITTHLANARGYKILRAGSEEGGSGGAPEPPEE